MEYKQYKKKIILIICLSIIIIGMIVEYILLGDISPWMAIMFLIVFFKVVFSSSNKKNRK